MKFTASTGWSVRNRVSARLGVCCLMTAGFLVQCGSPRDYTPLIGVDRGLVELTWGEGAVSSKAKVASMEGVEYLSDTLVVVTEDPLYISVDSVIPPRLGDLTYTQVRFTGGEFFGFPVEQWNLWFSEGDRLRNVDIVFPPTLLLDDVYESIGARLLTLYGIPEKGGIVWRKYMSRNWTERHSDGEAPETGALLTWGRIPGQVTLSYHDLVYADSLSAVEYGEPMTLRQWNTLRLRR